jgi:hypothetical protein
MARPKTDKTIRLTEEQIKMCAKYAAVGLTYDQMSALCDVSPATFDEILNRQPEARQAIEKGRSSGIGGIANTLYQQAMKGNTAAAIFYLKVKGRWAEPKEVDPNENGAGSEFKLNYKV